jgi:hypothetical protein
MAIERSIGRQIDGLSAPLRRALETERPDRLGTSTYDLEATS